MPFFVPEGRLEDLESEVTFSTAWGTVDKKETSFSHYCRTLCVNKA